MFRKVITSCALTLAVGVLAVGCSDSDDDSSSGGRNFSIVGNFPGSTVLSNNAASDGWGFSPNDQSLDDLNFYWNVSKGTAMAVLETNEGGNDHIFLSYFNGSSFGALQEVHGDNEDVSDNPGGVKFLWVGSNAGRWSGYGILLYVRDDQDPTFPVGTTVDEDSNERLYGAIVDPSGNLLGDAEILDFDGIHTGGDANLQVFGFASSSLVCTHEFSGGTDFVLSGQPTDNVHILFEKDPRTGSSSVGERLFALNVDVQNTDPKVDGLPVQTGATSDAVTPNSTGGTLATDDFMTGNLTVHNGAVFSRWGVDNSTNPDDTFVSVNFFDETGDTGDSLNLGTTPGTTTADTVQRPIDVFGPDHGLSADDNNVSVELWYAFYEESGFTDGTDGSRTSDNDLYVAQIEYSNGSASIARQEVDLYTGTTSLDAAAQDADGDHPVPGDEGGVNDYFAAMTRNGNLVCVIEQPSNETDDPDDNDANGFVTTADDADNDILAMVAVQTTTGREELRALADSVTTTERVTMETAAPNTTDTSGATPQDQDSVASWDFQIELAYAFADEDGDAFDCDRSCAIQGDANTVHIYYTQTGDFSTAASAELFQLHVQGGTIDEGATATDAPTLTMTSLVTVDSVDSDWTYFSSGSWGSDTFSFWEGDQVVVADAGDQDDDGDVIVYYASQGNSRTSDTDVNGAFLETRLYAQHLDGDANGSEELISSDGLSATDSSYQFQGFQGGGTTPRRSTQANHSGTRFDLFWAEDEGRDGNNSRLATRSFNKSSFNNTNGTNDIADYYTPDLLLNPEFIDNVERWELDEARVLHSGSTVGVFIDEGDHLYYRESSSGAGGYKSLELIDNFNAHNVWDWDLVRGPDQCNPLTKSIVWYLKDEPTGNGDDERVYIRTHN